MGKKNKEKAQHHEDEEGSEGDDDMGGMELTPELREQLKAHFLRSSNPEEYAKMFVSKLPAEVAKRVYALRSIQKDRDALYKQFAEELRQLELKYEGLYTPLYERRREIVAGRVEVTDEEASKGGLKVVEVEEDKKKEGEAAKEAPAAGAPATGIPKFWLQALKHAPEMEDMLRPWDEPVLEHLQDISATTVPGSEQGFQLVFTFAPNEYFTNTTLTKSYHLTLDEVGDDVLQKIEGTTINWNKGKNVTVEVVKKKQRSKKGGKTRVLEEERPRDSFFDYFQTPRMPGEEHEGESDDGDAEAMVEQDFEVGRMLKQMLIPRAVTYFTGEVPLPDMDDDDEDMDDDGEEDDDDDDEDDEPPAKPARGGGKKGGPEGGRGGGAGGEQKPPECKQQ